MELFNIPWLEMALSQSDSRTRKICCVCYIILFRDAP